MSNNTTPPQQLVDIDNPTVADDDSRIVRRERPGAPKAERNDQSVAICAAIHRRTAEERAAKAAAKAIALDDDFGDEKLAPRACRLDDESCESCQ